MKQKNTAAKCVRKYPSQEVGLYLEMPLGLSCWNIWGRVGECQLCLGWLPRSFPFILINVLLQCLWRFYSLRKARPKVGRAQSRSDFLKVLPWCSDQTTKSHLFGFCSYDSASKLCCRLALIWISKQYQILSCVWKVCKLPAWLDGILMLSCRRKIDCNLMLGAFNSIISLSRNVKSKQKLLS